MREVSNLVERPVMSDSSDDLVDRQPGIDTTPEDSEQKLAIRLATAGLLICALYFGKDVLIPLSLALLMAFVLDPFVMRLKRIGLPRTAAVAIVVSLTLVAVVMLTLFVGSQISALSQQLPTYQDNILTKLSDLRARAREPGMFEGVSKTYDAIKDEVQKASPPVAGAAPVENASAALAPRRVLVEDRPTTALEEVVGWAKRGSGPLSMAGIVFVFVVLILLDRLDLRDRLLRLWGGSLHRSTDAMDEAGRRISRYLIMQMVVNLSYGVPMAAGLWVIGVPGSLLWGASAVLLRFVPFIGPLLSSVLPLALAFAVDPSWHMVLWTIALLTTLQLISSYFVAPWLYGVSTGLSAISLMVAATFWTAMWGPIGLIMSTPLTVCLLVIGRHLPRLKFLDVLLGTQPALDLATRIYQRLLAGDVEEAAELANLSIATKHLDVFYNETGLAVLKLASVDRSTVAAQHRHRLVVGMDTLLQDLQDQYPPKLTEGPIQVVCAGGKGEVDSLAAKMLSHALQVLGLPAEVRPIAASTPESLGRLGLNESQVVCVSYFSPEPSLLARHLCKRLRRRWPDMKIVLAFWNAPEHLVSEEACQDIGADAIVASIDEAMVRIASWLGAEASTEFAHAEVPDNDAARVAALLDLDLLNGRAQALFDQTAQRAAEVFDVPLAMVSLITQESQAICGGFGSLPDLSGESVRAGDLGMPRSLSVCGHVISQDKTLVVPDISRDHRFGANPALKAKGLRFYAGAPLRDSTGYVLGSLCLLDVEPRQLNKREVLLLESMADDVMTRLSLTTAQDKRLESVSPTTSGPALGGVMSAG